jgi:DNA primase large subunit
MKMTIAMVALLALLAGCGRSADKAPNTSFNTSGDARYTEEQVAKLAGFRTDGISYTGPNDCQVSVIMTTGTAIATYAEAGDPVVTNPSGTVGVKFYPDPGCRDALLAALRRVR